MLGGSNTNASTERSRSSVFTAIARLDCLLNAHIELVQRCVSAEALTMAVLPSPRARGACSGQRKLVYPGKQVGSASQVLALTMLPPETPSFD